MALEIQDALTQAPKDYNARQTSNNFSLCYSNGRSIDRMFLNFS
jgi:hypothetical protein